MRPDGISALIIARDEAAHLGECLRCLHWADERVVVVDARSTDRTEAIARAHADRVFVREFDDFAGQRNAAREAATQAWVLAVDADERSSDEQAAEVRRLIARGSHAGYRVPIRSIVLGREFRRSGTQSDLPLRLFRRDLGRWVGEVHETVELNGSRGTLREPLRHQTLPDLRSFLAKINHYTDLEARRAFREGRAPSVLDLLARPFWTFAKLYLAKGGFLDGPEGFAFCALSGVSAAVREWKLRELARQASEQVTVVERSTWELAGTTR